ncbi:hypothetical protein [Ileibacterium valens]|uniref:hypothetical protein n=1 Tax=Ileibacterium valens TaxID=1862668 RepID=UPI00256FE420|nr:hypothetical protein [Ileibacterium valens]
MDDKDILEEVLKEKEEKILNEIKRDVYEYLDDLKQDVAELFRRTSALEQRYVETTVMVKEGEKEVTFSDLFE